jgi:mono/diheme cytochrome c family protein
MGALLGACSEPPIGDDRATLDFTQDENPVARLTLADLKKLAPVETWTGFDPYYQRDKTWKALPLEPILGAAFGSLELRGQELVLKATDGYLVPISGERLLEGGAYLAIADAEAPGWEPIGPQRANPAPFYLVWRRGSQQDPVTHPRPWQLASIGVVRFEARFPHTVPAGAADGSAARRGFALFRVECVRCHAINREGGRVGPDLNLPRSIVEYRPRDQIAAFIRNPTSFRYTTMPAHPHLTDADLDAILAYFDAMRALKHDPEAPGAAP